MRRRARRSARGEAMDLDYIIPMLLICSHVVTFILGYSLGAYVWFFYHRR